MSPAAARFPNTAFLAQQVAGRTGADVGVAVEVLDRRESAAGADAGAGQYELQGSLTDHPALGVATFSADTGETVSLDLPVRVVLDVRQGGESVVTGVAMGIAPITVTNTGVEPTATVAGSGNVEIAV